MKEEKQTLSEPMACSRSVANQSRLSSVCEDRAGWACLLSPSIFSFFPSFFFRFLSDNLTHARWPETEAGTRWRTKYKEQTHTHTSSVQFTQVLLLKKVSLTPLFHSFSPSSNEAFSLTRGWTRASSESRRSIGTRLDTSAPSRSWHANNTITRRESKVSPHR